MVLEYLGKVERRELTEGTTSILFAPDPALGGRKIARDVPDPVGEALLARLGATRDSVIVQVSETELLASDPEYRRRKLGGPELIVQMLKDAKAAGFDLRELFERAEAGSASQPLGSLEEWKMPELQALARERGLDELARPGTKKADLIAALRERLLSASPG